MRIYRSWVESRVETRLRYKSGGERKQIQPNEGFKQKQKTKNKNRRENLKLREYYGLKAKDLRIKKIKKKSVVEFEEVVMVLFREK